MESPLEIFGLDEFQSALASGAIAPPGAFAPFFRVDRRRFEALRKDKKPLELAPLRCRMGKETFARMRGAIGLTMRHSAAFFPAYRFLANEFLNEEWLSAVDWHKAFHRDHVLHQPMAAYVGMTLLDLKKGPFASKTILDHCVDNVLTSSGCAYLREYFREHHDAPDYLFGVFKDANGQITTNKDHPVVRDIWKALIKDAFFLAAMFHDIGYPWSFISKVSQALDGHLPGGSGSPPETRQLCERYRDHLLFYPFHGYRPRRRDAPPAWDDALARCIDKTLIKTHGLPGALTLLHLNDVIRAHPPKERPLRRFCLEWAAMAVMMHDMAEVYAKYDDDSGVMTVDRPELRISPTRDPLSFLLTLTDQIQDFERPDFTFKSGRKHTFHGTHAARCAGVDLGWDGSSETLKITYKFRNPGDVVMNKTKFQPKAERLYFDPNRGFLDYSSLGIRDIALDARQAPAP